MNMLTIFFLSSNKHKTIAYNQIDSCKFDKLNLIKL